MKLQGLGIIFIMIAFPLILVLSYYVQMQIDTITLQTSYDNKLIDATFDAMAAFEINTANEDLSAAADSLRSIVNASATTFTNTLGTSLGLSNASKERIREYIPVMLFTLYDGYYIYAPTEVPKIKEKTTTDGGIVISEGAAIVGEEAGRDDGGPGRYYNNGGTGTSIPDQANDYGSLLYEKDDGSYSTQIDNDTAMKQDYVLKSYMPYSATYREDGIHDKNSNGNSNDIVTINYTLDNYISISGTIGGVYYTKSGYYIKENFITDIKIDGINESIDNYSQDKWKEICEDESKVIMIKVDGIDIIAELINPGDSDNEKKVKEANRKAITYYLTNTAFSKWVNDNLRFVSEKTIQNNIFDNVNEDLYNVFDLNNENSIFSNTYDPEKIDNIFDNHKYNIIKNSIQYNLNLAISTYNEKYFSDVDFKMPQLTENEWKQITEKVSIVSFMQGLPCGTKQYIGYSVISSTNNELIVIPEEIYYVRADQFDDGISTYHRIDCPDLDTSVGIIAFKSKEVKYDKIYDKHDTLLPYKYDHKNLACYNCIVQSNYEGIDWSTEPSADARKKAYYIAIGKERQNLYKTTGYSRNEGINTTGEGSPISWLPNSIKAEVTIRVDAPSGIVGEIKVGGSGTGKMISTSTRSTQTVEIENTGSITGDITVDGVDTTVLSIKYIYK